MTFPVPNENVTDRHPLEFSIVFPDGSGYDVDLREFAIGGRVEDVVARARSSWAGDFVGRPRFANELATMIFDKRLPQTTTVPLRHAMRTFFRFLDCQTAMGRPNVSGIDDIEDGHGPAFINWLETKNIRVYRRTKTALDWMRELHGLPPLFWPARTADPVAPTGEPLERDAVKQLVSALKYEARSIKAMFAEGERLAASGFNPRGYPLTSDEWRSRENRAWMIKATTRERLLSRQEFIDRGLFWGMMGGPAGPSYLAPNMRERGREGIVGALRWFYPSYQDTAVFLWLFLLGTGWNFSTALSIDVTTDDMWHEPHPQNDKFAVIHAFKARADRHQFTLSLTKPEWHPYQILRYMMSRTEVLRATIRHRLAEARAHSARDAEQSSRRVAELEAMLRSPWLYHLVNKTGEVSAFNNNDSTHFGPLARTVARKHNLLDRYPSLENISTSDARDTWIGHAYVQSGYHVLITRLAAQHKNLKTLKHYLKSRRYRTRSENEVRKVQDTIFSEIAEKRIIDPTRLRLLVANGTITEKQQARLHDLRKRTRLGMGCVEPTLPPRHIAPDHKAGAMCRVQRCTGCKHGVVFAESLVPLARACAELIHIQRELPYASWIGSSFEEELASIEATLKDFDSDQVAAAMDEWSKKLQTGEVRAHDSYPNY